MYRNLDSTNFFGLAKVPLLALAVYSCLSYSFGSEKLCQTFCYIESAVNVALRAVWINWKYSISFQVEQQTL